ncbi:Oxidoreductase, 2-nitropropane dioxygenase family [Mycobacteroides abscessus subsp. abscessus]|nr:Oxidoreductase, 2-nitropropane dioxygenase family [Mycobacteroides abscessus subsp. abscessus]
MGAQGAWSGSQWLMVEEAENTVVQQETYAKATSRDTVRSRSFTPLQYMVSGMAVAATHKFPDQTIDVAFNPIGQVVGQFTKVEKSAAVIERWVQEYLEATNTLNELNEAAASV